MKRVLYILWLSLSILSCSRVEQLPQGVSSTATAEFLATSSAALKATTPVSSTTPSPSPIVSPSNTPTRRNPTATSLPQSNQRVLRELIISPYWKKLGLPQDRMALWQVYSEGKSELDGGEKQELDDFLLRWDELNKMAGESQIPKGAILGFKVKEIPVDQGETRLVIYPVDEQSLESEGKERFFLITQNSSGKEVSLTLAPEIEGLNQRVDEKGEKIEYVYQEDKVLLSVDAIALKSKVDEDEQLKKALAEVYVEETSEESTSYPRYRFPIEIVDIDFFAIEKLTYNQILLLYTALELFERPELTGLCPYIFSKGKGYIIDLRMDDRYAGMASSGAGIAWLDPEKIVGNRYYLAEVIAHEGAHLLQESTYICKVALRYEIGDGSIPPAIYSWSADELMKAITDQEIGAYHVSLWVLHRLGITDLHTVQFIIQHGRDYKQLILVNCP